MKKLSCVVLGILFVVNCLTGCFSSNISRTLPSLSEMALTADDVQKKYSAEVANTIFFREPQPTVSDISKELGDNCALDCVKKFWENSKFSTASITLIRASNPDTAKEKVQDQIIVLSRENSSAYKFDDDGFQKRNADFGLPDYTYIAVFTSNNSIEFYLVTNSGPIIIIITDEIFIQPGTTDIDLWSHALSLQFLAKLQAEKLHVNGYP